ncbi:RdgB/HAM1 family non-canonical purine NTP pyrophosphatase [Methylophilaceae bacterium]|nr:RdgB/HAM1 family non-canonical purine NTP pyrophosphatase [Methylophilaceae bacterium]
MQKIIIATNNDKKLNEIKSLMHISNINFCSLSDLNIDSCPEPFDTFIENALAKARHASKNTGLPAIADDSGICVDALEGKPGIRSARYASLTATDKENITKLLENLNGETNRKAHFYCSMVFVRHYLDPEPLITEGIWAGEILKSPQGSNGFGYDSIFLDFKTEKSSAELAPDIKNRISHRAQALQKLTHKLKMIYD